MNKKIIMLSVLFLSLLFITGCGNKTMIDTNEFKNKTNENGYTYTDVTSQFKDSVFIKEASIAGSIDGWQIEFYTLEDQNYASSMFEKNKLEFDNERGASSIKTSSSGKNYDRYSLTTSDLYMYLSRIDNTLIYVKENVKNKDAISEFIKDLGY